MKRQRDPAHDSRSGNNVDRRTFMGTMACAGAGMSLGALAKAQRATNTLHVNGVAHELDLEPGVTLLTGVAAAIANAVYTSPTNASCLARETQVF